jgi:hypothetical protein
MLLTAPPGTIQYRTSQTYVRDFVVAVQNGFLHIQKDSTCTSVDYAISQSQEGIYAYEGSEVISKKRATHLCCVRIGRNKWCPSF